MADTAANPTTDEARLGIGGNKPPTREEMLRTEVLERHKHLKARTEELLAQIAKVPEELPEEMARDVTDFIKTITAHTKAINGARVAEKEEYLKGARLIDGIFKGQSDPLEAGKVSLQNRLGVVQRAVEERRRKAAAEKAEQERREAEERRRAAEETARREAEEAAAKRREAEEAERKLEAQRRQIREETEAAERAANEAAAKADAERQEAERKKAEAEAAELESKRKAEQARREAQEAEERAKKAEDDADEAEGRLEQLTQEGRQVERTGTKAVDEVTREARQAERGAARAGRELDRAKGQEESADAKARKVETAPPSHFGQIRGDFGALATVKRVWTCANIDRRTIDLETLRPHIPEEALERAVRSFIAAGGRVCRGVDIYEENQTQVR